jgi:hypothetical protein
MYRNDTDSKTSHHVRAQCTSGSATRPATTAREVAHRARVAELVIEVLLHTEPSHGYRLMHYEPDPDNPPSVRSVGLVDITPAGIQTVLGRALSRRTAEAVTEKVREIDRLARTHDAFHRVQARQDVAFAADDYAIAHGHPELAITGGQW